ncbi:ectonucleotide pyrophosphatase/phosphodiesterase [Clostridium sardiniense]|uniref:alkaline phosphatase family protein n=1 Tax=Clostridium sardiniense TaxID=29369 RepID=UPI00195C806A|nr:ectonucleotide pyrophosphatase/phosphodiesterase [Clostridium sardiniense]MBM7833749.1 putative AlkP superfamily pyrophosphatase or phosphodiesterase [Clostridium sardiniense]
MKEKFIILSFDAVDTNDFKYIKTLPNFKKLMEQSSYSDIVKSVYPSLTYPAHVSISTGKYPINHGIVNNIKIEPFRKNPDWFWEQKYINGPTIYDVAKESGLRTCALLWPVTAKSKTIDLNLPEVFANRPWQNQILVSALNGTLSFQLKLNNLFGKLRDGLNQPNLDNFTFESLMYVLKNDLADFILVHLTDVDTHKHNFGIKSPKIKEALNRHDDRLGKIIKFLEDNNIYENSTLIALGDHSFKDADYVIKLNKFFLDKGYIKVNNKNKITSWDIYCNYCDGSAYIYINKNSNISRETVYALIDNFSKNNNKCIKNIYSNKEAVSFGADRNCDFMLEANDGYYFINSIDGYIIEETSGNHDVATHGYFPESLDYRTFFMIKGKNIKKNNYIGDMSLIDEGTTILNMLNSSIKECDGKILDIFKI